jgi:hypothetical protein
MMTAMPSVTIGFLTSARRGEVDSGDMPCAF